MVVSVTTALHSAAVTRYAIDVTRYPGDSPRYSPLLRRRQRGLCSAARIRRFLAPDWMVPSPTCIHRSLSTVLLHRYYRRLGETSGVTRIRRRHRTSERSY